MSSLVVGGVAIPVAPGSGSWDWNDQVDRRRSFDGSYRASATGGAARDGRWTTPPVTRANAAIYRAALQKVDAQLCTGDLIEIPTMCCSELIDERPVKVQSGSYVSLDFALHEQQGKKLLLKYSPGDTITGESFSRSTTAYQLNSSGILVSVAINTKRDGHYIGGVRTLLLEQSSTNNLLWASDFSNAAWVKTNMTVTTGIADPANALNACTLTATAINATANQSLAAGASLSRTNSVWLRRRTGTGAVTFLNASGTADISVTLTAAWQRFSNTAAANTARWAGIKLAVSGDAVDVFIFQQEDVIFATSEIQTTTVAVTRGADAYSLPFTIPPQEMTAYCQFVEKGTAQTNGGTLFIASSGSAAPLFVCFAASSVYDVRHNNGSVAVTTAFGGAPAFGDTDEIVSRLFGDGSVDGVQSINSAASTSAAQTAANALATAWSGNLIWLNSQGAGTAVGFTAIQSLKIVAGSRSLSEMRAA